MDIMRNGTDVVRMKKEYGVTFLRFKRDANPRGLDRSKSFNARAITR